MTINAAPLAAIFVAAVMLSSACATTAEPVPSTSSTATTSAPASTSLGDPLADLPGYTVRSIAPVDVHPTFVGPGFESRFAEVTAGVVSRRGTAVLRVVVGRLDSGGGEDIVGAFLADLSDRMVQSDPHRTVATGAEQVGGRPVTAFYVPLGLEGYTYVHGSTVAIAIGAGGFDQEASRDAFTKILAQLP